jgi:hypothetical protein
MSTTLTPDDDTFLALVHDNLRPEQPLDAGSPFYEPLHNEALGEHDPVRLMQREVTLSRVQSLQLFSGFSGGGKTTELLRLKSILETRGYLVLYADALTYLNPSEPVDISDLIMVLAGSFSDALADLAEVDIEGESFWTRFANFLTNTDVLISSGELRGELAAAGAVKAGISIKAEFKTGSSFRQRLQKALSGRLAELKAEADGFFEDGIKAVRAALGVDKKIVFIFDSLEQLRGNYQNWQSIIRSVEQVFTVHLDKLNLPHIHAIYSVPPWLKFIAPPEAAMTILPTVHLWNNDPDRSRFEMGWNAFRSLVRRRLGDDGLTRLFGPDPQGQTAAVDRLIDACGGHVRDLLRLLQSTLKYTDALPVSNRVLDSVINAAKRDFQPIALEDAKWLAEIGLHRDTVLQQIDERSVERLSNFLNRHQVMYFVNGTAWYDIHPLIRDEVRRIIQANS